MMDPVEKDAIAIALRACAAALEPLAGVLEHAQRDDAARVREIAPEKTRRGSRKKHSPQVLESLRRIKEIAKG